MTTSSLLWWVALLGGAELGLRGYLADAAPLFHAGAWLVVATLAVAARRHRALLAAALLPLSLSVLAALDWPGEADDPLLRFWREHASDREALAHVSRGDTLTIFGTSLALDQHGFRRQPAVAEPAYRIVAIGGSNTFGAPIPAEGPPWPELLERDIAQLGCRVPVVVFNAGRTGRGLAGAVRRFERDILPLAPDLILVYPAPADVFGVAQAAPAGIGVVLPLPERPSSLVARVEGRLRSWPVARRYREALAAEPTSAEIDDIPLAAAYRALLVKALRRGIDVALATPSLALDASASEAEIRPYEALDPRSRHAVLASRLDAQIVREVGASFRATLIDSGEGLDGAGDEAFLDLFHLKRAGRERLARNLLAGLRAKLASLPEPGCPPE